MMNRLLTICMGAICLMIGGEQWVLFRRISGESGVS